MSEVAEIPVAGKREQTKAQNRQAILAAAREVFGELGYETATVRDIIRRTGLAAGTFYNYYPSKEEVYAALADEGAQRLTPLLKAMRAEAADFEAFVRGAIGAYFQFLADEHQNWVSRRPLGEIHPNVQGETPEMAALFDEVRAAVGEALSKSHGAADADYFATTAIAISQAVGHRMLTRRPVDTDAATEFAVAMIMGGLRGLGA
jgi:AcrR family transcriptional regulator